VLLCLLTPCQMLAGLSQAHLDLGFVGMLLTALQHFLIKDIFESLMKAWGGGWPW
jgi:hypothetical protein